MSPPSTRPLHFLIVEDLAADAELIASALRGSGYDARIEIVDSEAGFRHALRAPLDLILCDYRLPAFDAPRALDILAELGLDIPFVLVSGTIGEELAVEMLRRGATDYLLKDRLGRLGPAVDRALDLRRTREERRQTERELRQLAAIVACSEDAIVSRGMDGAIQSWNAAAERMFGWSAQEALGRTIGIIVPPERRGELRPLIERVVAGASIGAVESTHRRKDGTRIETSLTCSAMRTPAGEVTGIALVYRDITERKRAEMRINHLTQHDLVTGLPNRVLFKDRLELAFARARRQEIMLAVLAIDLDRYREINEAFGHDAGDELLREVAARLKASLREVDTVACMGGNEFAVLAEGVSSLGDLTALAGKIVDLFSRPYTIGAAEIFCSASIGVDFHPNGGNDAQGLLDHAEIAMQRAKRDGGSSYQYFAAAQERHRGRRIALESRLRRAIQTGEFSIHYQPKVALGTHLITGIEALARWTNPELGAVTPAEFIPIAEETGLIVPIGEWVLRTACAQARQWELQGFPLELAVNLSPRQFREKNLAAQVAAALAETGLPPDRLELEITETTAMVNPEQAIGVLTELRQLGVRLAVDDFGTGYSSLNYLKRFPISRLKIDRVFVKDIGTDSHDEAIIQATIVLAHRMKIEITAEGVETETQRDFLERAGCDEYQGYLFSRPLPVADLDALLRAPGERLPASPKAV
jgi:diguanylate cyclase (GGDEF)-like protein/PAS domain S-box-containing protein